MVQFRSFRDWPHSMLPMLICIETNPLHLNSGGSKMWSKNLTRSYTNLLEKNPSKYCETRIKKKSRHSVKIQQQAEESIAKSSPLLRSCPGRTAGLAMVGSACPWRSSSGNWCLSNAELLPRVFSSPACAEWDGVRVQVLVSCLPCPPLPTSLPITLTRQQWTWGLISYLPFSPLW